jgi:hypothetical protein
LAFLLGFCGFAGGLKFAPIFKTGVPQSSATNSTASAMHLATQIGSTRLSWTAYEEGIGATT